MWTNTGTDDKMSLRTVCGGHVITDNFLYKSLFFQVKKVTWSMNKTQDREILLSDSPPSQHYSLEPRSLGQKITFTIVYVILTGPILCLNTLVICAYRKNRRLRTVINMFFVCLAASDVLVGAVSIPLWTMSEYNVSGLEIPGVFRKVYLFFDVFSALSSILFLAAICVEKHLAISRPINHRLFSLRYYHAAVLAIYSSALVFAVVYVQDLGPIWSKWRGLIAFLLGFLLPLCVIIILHISIWKNIRVFEARRRMHSTENRKLRSLQRQRRAAWTVAIVVGLFVVAWLPFFVLSLVFVLCGVRCLPAGNITRYTVDVVKLLHYSNSVVNPLVYGYRNVDMRLTVKGIVARPCNSGRFSGQPSHAAQEQNLDDEPIIAGHDRTVRRNKLETLL